MASAIQAQASRVAVPSPWKDEIESILIDPDRIERRVRELARLIRADFAGRDLVIVAVMNGTVIFLADLLRHLPLPLRLDFVRVSSYRNGTTPGALRSTVDLRLDLRGRDVLVIDDILDTGKTLTHVIARLRESRPRRIRTCVLLSKAARRETRVRGDYIGFEIPDKFVVGYGLDFDERYRNLPFIAVLKPAAFTATHSPPRKRAVAGRRPNPDPEPRATK